MLWTHFTETGYLSVLLNLPFQTDKITKLSVSLVISFCKHYCKVGRSWSLMLWKTFHWIRYFLFPKTFLFRLTELQNSVLIAVSFCMCHCCYYCGNELEFRSNALKRILLKQDTSLLHRTFFFRLIKSLNFLFFLLVWFCKHYQKIFIQIMKKRKSQWFLWSLLLQETATVNLWLLMFLSFI